MVSKAPAPNPVQAHHHGPQLSPPHATAGDRLLTEIELARRWCCSPKTLRNQRTAGGGCQFLRLGRLVRYRMSDILSYEAARVRSSTSSAEPGNE